MTQLYVLLFLLVLLPSGHDASINATCPGGWTTNKMSCKCYKLFFANKTWNEAKIACGKQRGKLAELKNFNTNDFIRAKFGEKAWIGSYRCGEDTCYLNNDYVPYTPYAPHEPDMKSDQQSTSQTKKENDFAIVIRPDGRWADEPKHLRYYYICEKDFGKSCASLYKNGVRLDGIYRINPDSLGCIHVRCDMQTDEGGWTVIQRRHDGSVDFNRTWKDYKNGFGNLSGEFWLGLDNIHRLTKSEQNVLRVDLTDFDNTTAYAKYKAFFVASESESYNLTVRKYSGNAGDSMSIHNGMKFSTRDKENDQWSKGNCAVTWSSAWWYHSCHYSDLNGPYPKQGAKSQMGIKWYHWKKHFRSMKMSEMKIRPLGY